MSAFFSWLSSQGGASLTVALIALYGVLGTTWWNNKAADERRREDQIAEDRRRKNDDDRREQERLAQLRREEWDRQRRAVATFIHEITKAASRVVERSAASHLSESGTVNRSKTVKAVELSSFFRDSTAQLTLLDLEITQPHVTAEIHALWEIAVSESLQLSHAQEQGLQEWIGKAEEMSPLSEPLSRQIRGPRKAHPIVGAMSM